jgi:nitrite reductase (cytochrome c-552)
MKFSLRNLIEKRPWTGWVLFIGTTGIVFILGMLAASIIQRRTEATLLNIPLYELDEFEPRNEMWGKAYPREYEGYQKMADTSYSSKHNGNSMRDALEEDPRLVILFAGYAFARDYKQPRGHIYAVTDVHNSLRTGTPDENTKDMQSSSCWTCKSPDVPRIINDIGAEKFYKTPWSEMLSEVVNPIGCGNCHNADDMTLKVKQIPLIEAYQRQNKDIHTTSINERRSLTCAQCHVEYYFKGEGKYVTFPWDKGMSAESMEEYYNFYEFTDWVHPLSKTPMIKAQHPDYEIYTTGIHHARGISCADCHMPYVREGSQKVTDHKIQSPLNNIENSCMVCHRESKDELIANVYDRQDKVYQQKILLEDLLVKAHIETSYAIELGASDEQLKPIHAYIRAAQWRWDYVAASHGGSFHSPTECLRVISAGIEKVSHARVEIARLLAELGYNKPVEMPDLSTRSKAQEYIGLDMKKLQTEKDAWLKENLPVWLKQAEEREAKMPEPKRIK